MFIAVLGLLGGFATPILLSTGENQPIPLFAYLLLLNVGLAWVAYRRGWIILSVADARVHDDLSVGLGGEVPRRRASAAGDRHLHDVPARRLRRVDGRAIAAAARRQTPSDHVEWTMLAASVLPVLFAVYLAMPSEFREHYPLIFGWLLLIDIGAAGHRDCAIDEVAARGRRA